MITIVTVLKSGGDYRPAHVRTAHNALKEQLAGYDLGGMVCLTDIPAEVEAYAEPVELTMDLPGWWSKLEVFQRGLFPGPVIYMDLDTLLLGPLDDLVDLAVRTKKQGPMMLRGRHPRARENNWPASGLMVWYRDQMAHVLDRFTEIGPRRAIREQQKAGRGAGQRGDQGFIRKVMDPPKLQDYLPPGYIKFKLDYEYGGYGAVGDAAILCWSGKPRVDAPKHPFIDSYWRRLSAEGVT
jgi:hypothetical protein